MTTETEFIVRDSGAPKGKDWDAFIRNQREVLAQRANDGWELITAVGIQSVDVMNTASRTSGVVRSTSAVPELRTTAGTISVLSPLWWRR